MGYDLHITRRQDWSSGGNDIEREEFLNLVRNDTEFKYPGEFGEDYADWRCPTTGYRSWLCWSNGQIESKNPEPELVDKMVAIARVLGGVVQGDDGEIHLAGNLETTTSLEHRSLLANVFKDGFWKVLLAAFGISSVVAIGLYLLRR